MKLVMSLILWLISTITFSQTENQLGPHRGFVRSVGNYNVEVMPKKNGVAIMLLDSNLVRPMVKDSKVKAYFIRNNVETKLPCKPQSNFFFCAVPPKMMRSNAVLKIESMRANDSGNMVKYHLPLTSNLK